MDIFVIYKKLLRIYGPQGWWPILIKNAIIYGIPYDQLQTYRTKFRDPFFEIAIGAILTQNTAWTNVAKAIKNLYKAKVLTPKKISALSDRKLQSLIRPSGYFRQKAKKLKVFSKWLSENYAGDILELKKHKIEIARAKLLAQWGIGKETADSILLYALNEPIFVVDAYTKRFCAKYDIMHRDYDDYRKMFEAKLKHSASLWQEYHALLVAAGKDKHSKIFTS